MYVPKSIRALNAKARHVGLRLIVLGLVLFIAISGIAVRLISRALLGQETAEAAIPTVTIAKPSRSSDGEALVLPGTVQAINQAAIYARISGYLKSWKTDIGTRVTKDQLLAEIDAPEVDQELRQAEADLATAQANYRLAERTNTRWLGLLATDSVSKQDADEKAGDAAAKKALVDSAAANVGRLREMESFKHVIAPFDGIVTARNTDIGNLINAGQGVELFRVADTSKLRIYVQVPESYAGNTKPGLNAELRFAEQREKTYPAEIVRTANALDPSSRTLQIELQVDNPQGELFPGAYAEVHFMFPNDAVALRVPATALLFRAAGLQVATVGPDHHVVLKTVSPGRDFGTVVEILSGLDPNDDIVISPPDSVMTGATVRVAKPVDQSGPDPMDGKPKTAHKS